MPAGQSYSVLGSVAANAAIDINDNTTVSRTAPFGQGFQITHVWAQMQSGPVSANTTVTVSREKIGSSNTVTNIGTFVLTTSVANGGVVMSPLPVGCGDAHLAAGETIRFITDGASDAATVMFGVLGHEVPDPLPNATSTSISKLRDGTGSVHYAAFTEV